MHQLEPSTARFFCHSVFTDKSIFSLNLPRTRNPHEIDKLEEAVYSTGKKRVFSFFENLAQINRNKK